MKKLNIKISLWAYFIIAVMLPSFILSFLALRNAEREEAYLEKSMQQSLQAEVTYVVSLINAQLKNIETELDNLVLSSPNDHGNFDIAQTQMWQQRSNLVKLPFVISSDKQLLYPISRQGSNPMEIFYARWNQAFFLDQEAIPVYENIASVFQDEILQQQTHSYVQSFVNPSRSVKESDYQIQENIGQQYALSQFKQEEPLRDQVYENAKVSGKKVYSRNVVPYSGKKTKGKGFSGKGQKVSKGTVSSKPLPKPESIFITETKKFSEIIKGSSKGIVPRMLDGRLHLMYWKKFNQGYIGGVFIDQDRLVDRIIQNLPNVYSSSRILTVLDENAKPLVSPKLNRQMNWGRPFVAQEINQMLPHWEVAAYLSNPELITDRARNSAFYIWLLICLLLISILTGGVLVLRSLFNEIRLAQQKTTFAANVSHELKTPLTSIQMFTEMLKEGRETSKDKQQQYLNIILSETDRLTRLINNVLDFSRMGRKQRQYYMKPVDLVTLCRQLYEGQKMRLQYNGFKFDFVTQTDSVVINCDEEALKQSVLNLLSNAEKYSDQIKEIVLRVTSDNDQVIIEVEDSGMGVSAKEQKNIFNEFYRVDDRLSAKTQGTGLGLTIAQKIIRDHGGEIHYQRKKQGSKLQIILPYKTL